MRFHEFNQLDEGVNDPHIFKAVFMAGSPGSGKTTIAHDLFAGTGLKHLNVDDFYNLMRIRNKTTNDVDRDYEIAWDKYRSREKTYIDGRLGLVIDGTGKNPNVMHDIKAKLESLGYETAMIFVNTTLETSLRRAAHRAERPGRDYGRRVRDEFVTNTWNRVQAGLGKLQNIFGNKFLIIDNNTQAPKTEYAEKALRAWLNSPPKNPVAREWMKAQRLAKK